MHLSGKAVAVSGLPSHASSSLATVRPGCCQKSRIQKEPKPHLLKLSSRSVIPPSSSSTSQTRMSFTPFVCKVLPKNIETSYSKPSSFSQSAYFKALQAKHKLYPMGSFASRLEAISSRLEAIALRFLYMLVGSSSFAGAMRRHSEMSTPGRQAALTAWGNDTR